MKARVRRERPGEWRCTLGPGGFVSAPTWRAAFQIGLSLAALPPITVPSARLVLNGRRVIS